MNENRSSRQSFLGNHSELLFQSVKVAVVGLGGGGSHIIQQLAHIGFDKYVIYDPQKVEETNLNRMVGATSYDVGVYKSTVMKRVIRNLRENPSIRIYNSNWQANPETLREADIIIGCLDSFSERRDLEATARRYLIPYLDIGMDVFPSISGQPPRMVGQIILSLPGKACMQCLGYLNETSLAKEAAQYGAAGYHPQVVWANGILASTAVGIGIQLLTGWTGSTKPIIYLSYDGNLNTLNPHPRLKFVDQECTHYPFQNIGDPTYRSI
ncbi:MAG TPA: ThiF family adenylyltransferase [Bacteroidales bacterium]|nr:ThiF family adenylyltransferase [Bacteroidales bacterium]